MIRSRRTFDPRIKPAYGTAEVDWGHPLSIGLDYLALMNEGGGVVLDIVHPTAALFGSYGGGGADPVWSATAEGLALTSDGAGKSYAILNRLANIGSDSQGSVVWRSVTTDAYNDNAEHFIWGTTTPGAPQFTCEKYSNNNWYIGWYTGAPDTRVSLAASAANWPQNIWANYQLTWNTTTGSVFYQNGKSIGSNGTGATTGSVPAMAILFANNFGASAGFNGSIGYWAYYRVALSQDQVLWLAAEPYVMLRPIKRVRYFMPAVAGGGLDTTFKRRSAVQILIPSILAPPQPD